jgi:hypothetical protein
MIIYFGGKAKKRFSRNPDISSQENMSIQARSRTQIHVRGR